jgi:hypothetical protein
LRFAFVRKRLRITAPYPKGSSGNAVSRDMKTPFSKSEAQLILSIAHERAEYRAAVAGVELESAAGSAIYDTVIYSTLSELAPALSIEEFIGLLARPEVLH